MLRVRIAELVKEKSLSIVSQTKAESLITSYILLPKVKQKRIDFKTIELFCKHLNCKPGDLFEYEEDDDISKA